MYYQISSIPKAPRKLCFFADHESAVRAAKLLRDKGARYVAVLAYEDSDIGECNPRVAFEAQS